MFGKNGGDDETRTRDLCRDSERFISTCKDLQEHGRHPKSLQVRLRHCYCVPRRVPRAFNSNYRILFETQGSDVGSTPTLTAFWFSDKRHPPTIGWQTPMATKDCIGPGSLCWVCSRKNKSEKHPEDVLMEPCASAVAKCIPTRT